jgi:hypothetical protein
MFDAMKRKSKINRLEVERKRQLKSFCKPLFEGSLRAAFVK